MVISKTSANVTLFDRLQVRKNTGSGWTTQDVADLYRIGDQLTQFGFPVSVHTGQTDEGDPWAVFERTGTNEVVVHVARINSELFIVDVVRDRVHRGADFRSLADELLAEAPLTLPRAENRGNVVLHPRMVMTAFVAAAFVLADFMDPSKAEAATLADIPEADPADGQEDQIELTTFPKQYWDEKLLGRDTPISGYSAQTIGMGALAAGLAVLSSHLTLDTIDGSSNDAIETDLDFASLFDILVPASTAAVLHVNYDPLFENAGSNIIALEQSQPQNAKASEKTEVIENVTPHQLIEFKDWNLVTTPTTSPAVALVPPLETDLTTLSVAKAAYDQQDFYFFTVQGDQPTVNTTTSSTESLTQSAAQHTTPNVVTPEAMDATEVFSHVVESVTILEKTKLSKLSLDREANGVIVVTMSDVADDVPDEKSLTKSFTVSLPETVLESDVQSDVSKKYQILSDLSQNVDLVSDVANILVYAGGNVEVSGFTFGRDSIAFIDELQGPEWLESVDVVGSDVVLMGQGGSVTLQDALTTLA